MSDAVRTTRRTSPRTTRYRASLRESTRPYCRRPYVPNPRQIFSTTDDGYIFVLPDGKFKEIALADLDTHFRDFHIYTQELEYKSYQDQRRLQRQRTTVEAIKRRLDSLRNHYDQLMATLDRKELVIDGCRVLTKQYEQLLTRKESLIDVLNDRLRRRQAPTPTPSPTTTEPCTPPLLPLDFSYLRPQELFPDSPTY